MLRIESGVMNLKQAEKYFSKHVWFNSLTHVIAGVGIGALITNSFLNPHPLRYGVTLLVVALLFHVYAYVQK